MEFDELKAAWKATETLPKTGEEIKAMLKENRHPVLKGLRKQIKIELAGWMAFLACYYTMFDGDKKPFFVNILLLFAVITPMLHSVYGYHFTKHQPEAPNVKVYLKRYLGRMKVYAIFSILTRVLFTAGLLLFFTYNLNLNAPKYELLKIVVFSMLLIQVFFLYKIWTKRLNTLRQTLHGFS